jgi:branched-chain amino acid transport system substrate-binding protein
MAASAAILAAVLVAAGCSSSSKSTSNSGSGGGSKAAINIGQVGAYSGPVPGLDGQGYGLQAWVKYTNAHGGINGHQINLTTGDSKGDPTTEVSQIVQVATQHKVIAFAGMGTFNLAASTSFLDQHNIPVIGGNNADIVWDAKPLLYPQGTSFVPLIAAGFGAVPSGKTQVGVVYCKESPACAETWDLLFKQGITKAAGGNPVYASEASLASPSFTAQCLGAKQAGVQTLPVAFDGANLLRLANDCAKQNYRPVYTFGGTVATDQLGSSPNLNGAVAAQSNAPWFLNTGPLATMRSAMAQYEPGKEIGSITVEGWASGVILGQAIQNALSLNGGKAVTSADLLNGLGQIKNDTFGGLTPPLTYTSSGVQPTVYCYFPIMATGGKWTAPNNLTPQCPTDSQKAVYNQAQSGLIKS